MRQLLSAVLFSTVCPVDGISRLREDRIAEVHQFSSLARESPSQLQPLQPEPSEALVHQAEADGPTVRSDESISVSALGGPTAGGSVVSVTIAPASALPVTHCKFGDTTSEAFTKILVAADGGQAVLIRCSAPPLYWASSSQPQSDPKGTFVPFHWGSASREALWAPSPFQFHYYTEPVLTTVMPWGGPESGGDREVTVKGSGLHGFPELNSPFSYTARCKFGASVTKVVHIPADGSSVTCQQPAPASIYLDNSSLATPVATLATVQVSLNGLDWHPSYLRPEAPNAPPSLPGLASTNRSPSTVSDARALESTEQQQQQRGRLGGAVVSLHAASGSEEQRAEEKREREELGGELGARGGLEYLVYQDPSLSRLEPWNVSINTSTMVTVWGRGFHPSMAPLCMCSVGPFQAPVYRLDDEGEYIVCKAPTSVVPVRWWVSVSLNGVNWGWSGLWLDYLVDPGVDTPADTVDFWRHMQQRPSTQPLQPAPSPAPSPLLNISSSPILKALGLGLAPMGAVPLVEQRTVAAAKQKAGADHEPHQIRLLEPGLPLRARRGKKMMGAAHEPHPDSGGAALHLSFLSALALVMLGTAGILGTGYWIHRRLNTGAK